MRRLAIALWVAGCAGQAPPNVDNPPDASGGDDGPVVDAAPIGQTVSGTTYDYFTPAMPASAATITTDGLDPPVQATTSATGNYALDGVPPGSVVYLTATLTDFRPTRNDATTIAAADVTQDLFILKETDVTAQYTAVTLTPTAGTAVLAIELLDDQGAPLSGIAASAITLTDGGGAPAAGTHGPYFIGASGSLDPAATMSAVYGGHSRAMILDAPPGPYTLTVTFPASMGGVNTSTTPVTFIADGATLAASGGTTSGSGSATPTFATDIYPKLQSIANGGLGCGDCHTAGGLAGSVIQYDTGATTTLTAIDAAGVLDLANPAASLFLTKPLYEPPPYNHPNATFLSTADPNYQLFLRWIQQGAAP
ncbi:MAG TPA: carboxypeptidase-like regulatory domain-containing protein [Kofleriaceae bacterium]|jgi:hypothetical protein